MMSNLYKSLSQRPHFDRQRFRLREVLVNYVLFYRQRINVACSIFHFLLFMHRLFYMLGIPGVSFFATKRYKFLLTTTLSIAL